MHGDAKFARFFSSKILNAREKKKIKGHCQEKKNTALKQNLKNILVFGNKNTLRYSVP